jgi:galacturan 1,4-alpha-galacturonidase
MLWPSPLFLLTLAFGITGFQSAFAGSVQKSGDVCIIIPDPKGGDDSAAIIDGFKQCKTDSRVVFLQNKTYHIEKEMVTTGLKNVTVEHRGRLLVCLKLLTL